MDDVVRDAVMIGAAAIQPIIATRSEVARGALERGRRRERWERVAVSSAKQCGRAVVPLIHEAASFERHLGESTADLRIMCVEPSSAVGEVIGVQAVRRPAAADVIVGPEGGWSGSEVAAAHESGAMLVSLGNRTLRADAVPMVALTALLTTWGELK